MGKAIQNDLSNLRIGVTGASGSLGQALINKLKTKGAFVIGLTSKPIPNKKTYKTDPDEWVNWECGKEDLLDQTLNNLNILVLNHGINRHGSQSNEDINKSLEINALSTWRLIQRFESIANCESNILTKREIWVNTSEAEIQPALSPTYEISKRLIGQLVTIKMKDRNKDNGSCLKIRKLVLGPFRSNLNPIGIMNADSVANQIIKSVEKNKNLIIVSPNPFTYIAMPLTELVRNIYFKSTQTSKKQT